MTGLHKLKAGGLTSLCLVGGMLVGVLVGALVHGGLPGHLREATRVALAALPALGGTVSGGALWGLAMGRVHSLGGGRSRMLAGALAFGPTVIAVAFLLGSAEVLLVESGDASGIAIHQLFLLLFVPAAFVVAAIGSWSQLKGHERRLKAALRCGLAGAAAFALMTLIMDTVGWRVGAPGAVERATMITVLTLASTAAAFAGGVALSTQLAAVFVSED